MFDDVEVEPPPGEGGGPADPARAEPTAAELTAAELAALRDRLTAMVTSGWSAAELVDVIRAAEEIKNAMAGVQATAAVELDMAVLAKHAAAGMAARQCGAGVATELGLARRESLTQARRHLGLAKILTSEMPHAMAALRSGVLSEWRTTIIARETACLSLEHRGLVDAELCAGPDGQLGGGADRLHGWGDRQLAEETRKVAYRLDPHAVTKRAARAAEDRYVSFRPAPDTMVKVTAMLPVIDGVAVQAALLGAYQASRCGPGKDDRSKGQVMADTLVDRLTGRTPTTATTATGTAGGAGGVGATGGTGDTGATGGTGGVGSTGATRTTRGTGGGHDARTTWDYARPGRPSARQSTTPVMAPMMLRPPPAVPPAGRPAQPPVRTRPAPIHRPLALPVTTPLAAAP